MQVLCLGFLSWNGHSFRLSISKEGDRAFQTGMVAGGIWSWVSWVTTALIDIPCGLGKDHFQTLQSYAIGILDKLLEYVT